MRLLLPLLVLLGCKPLPEETDVPSGIDTGWFDDTDHLVPCEDLVTSANPVDGDTDWYWREPIRVRVETEGADAYAAEVRQEGIPLTSELVWDESGLAFTLDTPVPLVPETDHQLVLVDCQGTTVHQFRTNAFGLPLTEGTGSLWGNTYVVDLAAAEWIEPGGFGSILQIYFSAPILVGVTYAQGSDIDLMGAVGYRNDLGEILQDPTQDTFDFPVAANTDLPWFQASSDILVTIDGVPITIYGFELSGTFAPDGSALGGATVEGLGDTRAMGALVDRPGDEGALCEMAGSLGAQCQDCPDGEPYCLALEARSVDGSLAPGLRLVRRAPSGG